MDQGRYNLLTAIWNLKWYLKVKTMNSESVGWTNVKNYAYDFLNKREPYNWLDCLKFLAGVICWTCVIGISCHPPLWYK